MKSKARSQIVFLLILFTNCCYAQNTDSLSHTVSTPKIFIFKKLDFYPATYFKFSKNELVLVDSLLQKWKLVNNMDWFDWQEEFVRDLEEYNRQYYPYEEDSCKWVAVNCFCGDVRDRPDWKKRWVNVFDGGNCYYKVWLNLTKRTFSSWLDEGGL